ncbi:hypothetical protein PM8797T_06135 [Gimesia maris DSM 8797]|nr:hypothetical protein PM8797T_06135 [Gimesia maris DSM 8797]
MFDPKLHYNYIRLEFISGENRLFSKSELLNCHCFAK